MAKVKGKIKISCTGATVMDIEALTSFQGKLKSLSNQNATKLKKEILELGFSEPVGVWVDGNKHRILSGHQRVAVLKMLRDEGYTVPPIPVNTIEAENEKEAKRKILALTSAYGTMEMDGLMELAGDAELTLPEIDENFTFPELESKIKLEMNSLKVAGKTDDDAVPAAAENPTAKYGEVYQLGQHRLMCGDATKKEDVDTLMADDKADMIFTDPPWNVAIGQDSNPRHRQRTGMKNDQLSDEEYKEMLKGFLVCAKPYLRGDIYCVLGNEQMPLFDAIIRSMNYHWSSIIVWVKDIFVLGRSKYHRRYEPIWYGWLADIKSSYAGDRKQDDVWEISRPKRSNEHPTMKPVELCCRAIINSSRTGGIVLDMFGGAGSTLIACEKLGRQCRMMEIDPVYIDVIIKRWEEYTGKKAELLKGARVGGPGE